MKFRRHHNNKGLRQIKRGKTFNQVKGMAGRLFKKFVILGGTIYVMDENGKIKNKYNSGR